MKSIGNSAWIGLLVVTLLLPGIAAAEGASSRYVVACNSESSAPANVSQLIQAAGGSLVKDLGEIGVVIAESSDPSFAAVLGQNPAIKAVSPDRNIRDLEASEPFQAEIALELPATAATKSVGTQAIDPFGAAFLGFQWNLSQIRALDAWAAGHTGDPEVVVAIVDSGVDYNHIDLAGRIDLDRSVNLRPDEDALREASFPGALPFADLHGHGTHLAGLIACNALGVACVAPNVTLVVIKALDNHNDGPASKMIEGIVYATSLRPNVITAAFILLDYSFDSQEDVAIRVAFQRAVRQANQAGAVVVADAGAGGVDADKDFPNLFLPAQVSGTIAPSGTNRDQGLGLSNFGFSLVDVAAPAGALSASPLTFAVLGPCSAFSIGFVPGCQRPNPTDPFRYLLLAGQAVPVAHVAGVAALLSSQGLNPAQIKARILNTATDIGKPGNDALFGRGLLDAAAATE